MDWGKLRGDFEKLQLVRVEKVLSNCDKELTNVRNLLEQYRKTLDAEYQKLSDLNDKKRAYELLKLQGRSISDQDWEDSVTMFSRKYESIEYKSPILELRTTEITCTGEGYDNSVDHSGRLVEVTEVLGRFIVKIDLTRLTINFSPADSEKNWRAVKDIYGTITSGSFFYHPHLHQGSPCWGNHDTQVRDLLANHDLTNLLLFIHNWLSSWNRGHPYVHLNGNKILGKCTGCTYYIGSLSHRLWIQNQYGTFCTTKCFETWSSVECAACHKRVLKTLVFKEAYCNRGCYIEATGKACRNDTCTNKALPEEHNGFCSLTCAAMKSVCDSCGQQGEYVKQSVLLGINYCSASCLYDSLEYTNHINCVVCNTAVKKGAFLNIMGKASIEEYDYKLRTKSGIACSNHL